MMRTKAELRQMQSLPLEYKIEMTIQRIKGWYESWVRFTIENDETGKQRFVTMRCNDYFDEPTLKDGEWISDRRAGQVYISFSGGKDSTVLLHIARQIYSDIEAVFVNTGLEYPEIQKFVKSFENVTILRPKMRFDEVIKKYGYPLISKNISRKIYDARNGKEWALKYVNGTVYMQSGEKSFFCVEKYADLLKTDFRCSDSCCAVMKKSPVKSYAKKTGKKPITAQMAAESKQRETQCRIKGCTAFDTKNPISNPMAFWTEQDVLQYIKQYNVPIASVYGDVVYEKEPEQMRIEDFGIDGCGTEKLCTTGCDRTGQSITAA